MKPTIGRIVHYENPRDGAQAAIITGIHDEGVVHLHIFGISGDFRELCVPYSAEPKPLHWGWPPREEAKETREILGPGKPLPPQRYTGPAPIQLL